MSSDKSLSYKDAGVDIAAGDRLVADISKIAKKATNPGAVSTIGGFAGVFDIAAMGFKDPLLVAATDGVGTKLQLAEQARKLDTVGVDLVAMCANDILAMGATPMFFLDYLACGKLDPEEAAQLVSGIADGCKQSGMALLGGESAEMPGLYPQGSYDLAGFCVGAVERGALIEGNNIKPGDSIIAIASSGVHSNGYSLVRRVMQQQDIDQAKPDSWPAGIKTLLNPTRIYVESVLPLVREKLVHGIAHITGGGLAGNIPRILPDGTTAVINKEWQWPEVFVWLKQQGNIGKEEMLRTFNCGVGMVVIVTKENTDEAIGKLREAGEDAWPIGYIDQGTATASKTLTWK